MGAIEGLRRRTPFVDHLAALAVSPAAGVRASEPRYGFCTIQARRNPTTPFARAVDDVLGVAPNSGPKVAFGRAGGGLIGVGPETWLAFQEAAPAEWPRLVAGRLAGVAAVNDQTGGYAALRLSGPCVRELLSKGAFLDFHPASFRPRSAAVTLIAHIGVTLWLRDDGETFEAVLFRSYADSFWRWLDGAAAEYGLARGDPA